MLKKSVLILLLILFSYWMISSGFISEHKHYGADEIQDAPNDNYSEEIHTLKFGYIKHVLNFTEDDGNIETRVDYSFYFIKRIGFHFNHIILAVLLVIIFIYFIRRSRKRTGPDEESHKV